MMKIGAIIFLALVSCQAVNKYNAGYVAHGHEAKLGQFPWQGVVHVVDTHGNNNYRCLGVLLDTTHIITTDKCVTDKEIGEDRVSVHLGVIVARKTDFATRVLSAVRDPAADLAVLTVAEVTPSVNIRAIPITAADEILDGTMARTSGWGEDNTFIHEQLQFDNELVASFDATLNAITSATNAHHACTWDQGTGLISFDPNNEMRPTLSGIAQKNRESCEGDAPPPSKYISTFQNKEFIAAALGS